MKQKHRYVIGLKCSARGRDAIIEQQLTNIGNWARYRVQFTDKWAAADPFAIVFEDDIVIEKGKQ